MNDDIETLREALQFYADPPTEDENGEELRIPDFYSELNFGDFARKALAVLERVAAERNALREKLRMAQEALNDAANIAIRIPAQHLGMDKDQRVYSWHDVMDGLSKAMTAIRARAALTDGGDA